MNRPVTWCSLLAFTVVFGLTWLVPAGRTEPAKKTRAVAKRSVEDPQAAEVVKKANQAAELRKKLARPINLEKDIGRAPFKDVIEHLADRYDLTIIIDQTAFRSLGLESVEEQAVQLPKVSGLSLSAVLRLVLGQVKAENHTGTFLLRRNYIEVTTSYHVAPGYWKDGYAGPAVDAEFDQQPLDEALRELADQTGINIVLDASAAGKAKPVTATFTNVPLTTAVRLLADMAGLKSLAIDHAFYVTTKENAKVLEAEQEERRWRDQ